MSAVYPFSHERLSSGMSVDAPVFSAPALEACTYKPALTRSWLALFVPSSSLLVVQPCGRTWDRRARLESRNKQQQRQQQQQQQQEAGREHVAI